MFEERAPAERKIDQSTIGSSEPAALGFEWDAKDVEREKLIVVRGGGWRGGLKIKKAQHRCCSCGCRLGLGGDGEAYSIYRMCTSW